jgi:two-component system cell cycle sensor histidine kinase/response regulator CckA
LATVYGIVKQNGGHIWVYSEPGLGTTFKIYFPTADHRLDSAPKAAPDALPPRANGETILLVEDDPLMRALTRQMLQDHGYLVLDAENGSFAFKRLESHPGPIDLVLTDVVMRGMSGPELAGELTRRHPKIKVIFMSGYTGELLEQNGSSLNATAMLDKPFTRAQLLKTLYAALRPA